LKTSEYRHIRGTGEGSKKAQNRHMIFELSPTRTQGFRERIQKLETLSGIYIRSRTTFNLIVLDVHYPNAILGLKVLINL